VCEPVPIGRPIAGTSVFVVDPTLGPVPEMVPGELVTGGDGLAWGYLDRPALTAERFVPDPFAHRPGGRPGGRLYRTGDLARWRHDGTLDFLGRTDHQVKLRGFRIELGEVEAALAAHPAVAEAVVVADRVAGQKALVAYLVADGDEAPSPAELRRHATERLAAFMVPSAFVVLERLPLTANGKVDRRRLPRPSAADRAAGDGYVEPATETERRLAALWAEILDVERVGAEDDFFHLGGHSLLATRLVARLRAEDGVAIPMNRLFEAPTVRRFAEVVDAGAVAGESEPGVAAEGASSIARRTRRRIVRRKR
jgi:acyl carrier protein